MSRGPIEGQKRDVVLSSLWWKKETHIRLPQKPVNEQTLAASLGCNPFFFLYCSELEPRLRGSTVEELGIFLCNHCTPATLYYTKPPNQFCSCCGLQVLFQCNLVQLSRWNCGEAFAMFCRSLSACLNPYNEHQTKWDQVKTDLGTLAQVVLSKCILIGRLASYQRLLL